MKTVNQSIGVAAGERRSGLPAVAAGVGRDPAPAGELLSLWLGRMPYVEAWDLQRRLAAARAAGQLQQDLLLLLEHPPTFTMGSQTPAAHVRWSSAQLAARGVQVHRVDRGGLATYHGPGQLVGYPIIHLGQRGLKVRDYIRRLEAGLIAWLARWDITAGRKPGLPGVWVGDAKVAALGVRVSRAVTTHGFALNIHTDLSYFEGIVACGAPQYPVTSVAALVAPRTCRRTSPPGGTEMDQQPGSVPDLDRLQTSVAAALAAALGFQQARPVASPAAIGVASPQS